MRIIETPDAPSHAGPVPQAVESGGWIFVSALFGTDPQTGRLPDDVIGEIDRLFANLAAVLAAADARLTDVVRVGIVMRDLQRDRPAFNEAWVRHFGDHRPARSAIESAAFGRAGLNPSIMIEAVAHRPRSSGGDEHDPE